MSEVFGTNAPDPPCWTLNSCFVVFHTVCVHLGPLSCLTKLGAKHSELVQKFVPRSCVESFLNERTRSTPLDPKLMFWCVLYHFGAFGTIWLPYEIGARRAEQVQKFVPRSRVRIFHNERTRSTPLDPKLMFCCLSCHFGCIWNYLVALQNWCKMGRTSQKVRAPKSRQNFSQRTHLIDPIGP